MRKFVFIAFAIFLCVSFMIGCDLDSIPRIETEFPNYLSPKFPPNGYEPPNYQNDWGGVIENFTVADVIGTWEEKDYLGNIKTRLILCDNGRYERISFSTEITITGTYSIDNLSVGRVLSLNPDGQDNSFPHENGYKIIQLRERKLTVVHFVWMFHGEITTWHRAEKDIPQ